MKALKWLSIIALIGVTHVAFCANSCSKLDFECYVSGPSQNTTTVYRVDSSGNVTTNGGLTVLGTSGNSVSGANTYFGSTNYSPSSVVVIPSSFTSFNITSTFMPIASGPASGVTVGVSGVSPYNTGPSTATANNGQFVILEGTSAVSSVTLSSNTAVGATMWLGAATRVIDNQHMIGLVFDAIQGVWKEVFYR